MSKSPVFLLLFLVACSSSDIEEIEVKNESGQVVERFWRRKKDFAKEGRYQAFHPNGAVREEAIFHNDSLDGEHKFFYPSGTVEIIEHRRMGNFEGKFQDFYESGTLKSEGEYRENAMTGPWRFLYQSGTVKELVEFRDNEENGPFKEFYESGVLKTEGNYHNGDNEHGELKLYDAGGQLEKIMDCENGACRTRWERTKSGN